MCTVSTKRDAKAVCGIELPQCGIEQLEGADSKDQFHP